MINHSERAHAVLSASGADKWLNCPPSARLEESYPDTSSPYAKEGTLAHEIAEFKTRNYFIETLPKRTFTSKLNKFKKDELYQNEMDEYTESYLEYIKEVAMKYPSKPYIALEKKIDFSKYVPDGYGTCDCILIHGNDMHIIDFKYGKGVPVSAENNSQLMLYALGALEAYSMLYQIETVHLSIFQPRIDNISCFEISAANLLSWAVGEVEPKAKLAYDGIGDFKAGEHCRFCKAQAQCRAKAESIISVFPIKEEPALLTDDEIGLILAKAKELVSWSNAVEDYALNAILSGKEIQGWKAVEGRSVRVFSDADKAFEKIVESGTPEEMLYERKPLSLSQIEKLLGKKEFESIVSSFVIKPQGKPTLAPSDDKRPVFNKADVFENIIDKGEN
jgi:phage protein